VLRRGGTTLVELLVALALCAVLLAAASGSLLRHQRSAHRVGALAAAESQTRHALRLLAGELAALDPAAGDIAPGATDSTLELRAVVASALVCDSADSAGTLAPVGGGATPLGGLARAPAPGDTLWYHTSDSLGWRARAVLAVARTSAACAAPATASGATDRLTLDAPVGAGGGTPLRITRRERWVVYRASDGRWSLGVRDWSVAAARFLAPQPVAGPFVRVLPSGERTGFRYFDAAGAALVPDGTNEGTIARVRVTALAALPGWSAADSVRRDSADASLARPGTP
jgi:type II secretory pathway pseudopilin PulG